MTEAHKASLTIGDTTAELPIVLATDGKSSIDISKLTAQTGFTTFDQGFVNTASTRSAITYIDGDEGILRYRGYDIADLAAHSTYLEVAWLLIHGELPSASELAEFDERIRHHTLIHEDLKRFFQALPHTAHPMSVLSSAVSALSTYYEDDLDPKDRRRSSSTPSASSRSCRSSRRTRTRRRSARRSCTRTIR